MVKPHDVVTTGYEFVSHLVLEVRQPAARLQSDDRPAGYVASMKHLRWFALFSTLALNLAIVPHVAGAATMAPKAYIGLFKDNAIAVFDTGSSQVIKTIPIAAGPHGLVVTPDGHWVYASSDGDAVVSVVDTTTDEVTRTIDVGPTPHGLAITPDGTKVLVAGFGSNQVEAIDTGTNAVIWKAPVAQPHNIAITPDGTTAYAGSQKDGAQALAIINIADGSLTGSIPLDHSPRALNVSPDAADVVYTLAGVDALQVVDLGSNQLETQIPTGASPHHPLFTPDGKLGLVVSQGPGTLDLFDPSAYTGIGSIKVGTMPHWIGVSSDSMTAYVTNENSNDVSVVDLMSRTVKASVPVGNAPRKIVVQPTAAASSSAVTIDKFAFAPKDLTVKVGQTVTFTNNDSVAHTATSEVWDSGELVPGASYSFTPQQAGSYAYHCTIHPFMSGTLIVTQ